MMAAMILPGAVPASRDSADVQTARFGRLRWNREDRTGRIDGKTLEKRGATGRKGLLAGGR
jgi:hypothetical protein